MHAAMACIERATRAHLPLIHDQLKALAADGAGGQVCSALQRALCAAGVAYMQPPARIAQEGPVSHAGKGLGPGARVPAACMLTALRPKCRQTVQQPTHWELTGQTRTWPCHIHMGSVHPEVVKPARASVQGRAMAECSIACSVGTVSVCRTHWSHVAPGGERAACFRPLMERQSATAWSELGALLAFIATARSDGSRLRPDTAICRHTELSHNRNAELLVFESQQQHHGRD